MKISELEKEINSLESKIKILIDDKSNIYSDEKKIFTKMYDSLFDSIMNKYLERSEKEIFNDFYTTETKLKEERNKKEKDQEKINELLNKKEELVKTIESFIFEKLENATDEEKIVVGEYLYKKEILRGCGGFGDFKNPTTCKGCHINENVIIRLRLKKYIEFVGDRCYRLPQEIKEEALIKLAEKKERETAKALNQKKKKIESTIEKLEKEKDEKKKLLRIYLILKHNNKLDYEEVHKSMPELMETIKGMGGVKYVDAEPKENIGVVLVDESAYYGSGGCEYGVSVIAFRDGETEREYFKWRDPYSPSKDAHWLHFKEAEIKNITEDGFDVILKNYDGGKETKHFALKKQKNEKNLEAKLSPEEQKEFIEYIDECKKELLKRHYRENAMMPRYVTLGENLRDFQGTVPRELVYNSEEMIPYQKPEIVDCFIDKNKGEAILVVKAQIDYAIERGLQYEWVVYHINNKKEIKPIERECAYQYEIRHGKRIDMKASELYKKIKEKKD